MNTLLSLSTNLYCPHEYTLGSINESLLSSSIHSCLDQRILAIYIPVHTLWSLSANLYYPRGYNLVSMNHSLLRVDTLFSLSTNLHYARENTLVSISESQLSTRMHSCTYQRIFTIHEDTLLSLLSTWTHSFVYQRTITFNVPLLSSKCGFFRSHKPPHIIRESKHKM